MKAKEIADFDPVDQIKDELQSWVVEYGTQGVIDTLIQIYDDLSKFDENGCEAMFKAEAKQLRSIR